MIGVVAMFAAIGWGAPCDPIERIRYDDPDAEAVRSAPTTADAWDRARDARIADQLEGR
ncbi:hypothetical protein GS580_27730 [Rhodococcus hoagii]|nr:hypothetical protein [Prescottella equi]